MQREIFRLETFAHELSSRSEAQGVQGKSGRSQKVWTINVLGGLHPRPQAPPTYIEGGSRHPPHPTHFLSASGLPMYWFCIITNTYGSWRRARKVEAGGSGRAQRPLSEPYRSKLSPLRCDVPIY